MFVFYFPDNSCGYPGGVDNGEVVGDNYDFGESVTYKCNAGYQLIGRPKRTCQNSGSWDGSKPTCQGSTSITINKDNKLWDWFL